MLRRLTLPSLLALTLGLSACTVVTDNGDFSVSGSWTVDGFVPTTDLCFDNNVDQVEVVFYAAGSSYVEDSLLFDCEVGAFETNRFLLWGNYDVEWIAIGFDGSESSSGLLQLDVFAPTSHATLLPVDFVK